MFEFVSKVLCVYKCIVTVEKLYPTPDVDPSFHVTLQLISAGAHPGVYSILSD